MTNGEIILVFYLSGIYATGAFYLQIFFWIGYNTHFSKKVLDKMTIKENSFLLNFIPFGKKKYKKYLKEFSPWNAKFLLINIIPYVVCIFIIFILTILIIIDCFVASFLPYVILKIIYIIFAVSPVAHDLILRLVAVLLKRKGG